MQFMQANSLCHRPVQQIYIYIYLEILEVAEIINKCIFLKFIIKKSLINSIYYLTKCHLHKYFLSKKFNDRNDKEHDYIGTISNIDTRF